MNCQKCDGVIVYPEGLIGEKICSSCGLVIDDDPSFKIYTHWSPEWHSNWNEEDSETLKEWLTILRTVTCQLNIPNFPYREEAARTIRKQNHELFRLQKLSKNKRTTIAALMHLILREYHKTRSVKEISKELSIDPTTLMKQTWVLNKTLNGKENKPTVNKRKTAIDYLHEYSGRVITNKDLILDAEQVIKIVKKAGGNPVGLAAGALYYSIKKKKVKVSKEKIGESFDVSHRTVYANEVRIRRILAKKVNMQHTNLTT